MVVYIWSLATQEAKARGLWVQGQPVLHTETLSQITQSGYEEPLPDDAQSVLCAGFTREAKPMECEHVVNRIYQVILQDGS